MVSPFAKVRLPERRPSCPGQRPRRRLAREARDPERLPLQRRPSAARSRLVAGADLDAKHVRRDVPVREQVANLAPVLDRARRARPRRSASRRATARRSRGPQLRVRQRPRAGEQPRRRASRCSSARAVGDARRTRPAPPAATARGALARQLAGVARRPRHAVACHRARLAARARGAQTVAPSSITAWAKSPARAARHLGQAARVQRRARRRQRRSAAARPTAAPSRAPRCRRARRRAPRTRSPRSPPPCTARRRAAPAAPSSSPGPGPAVLARPSPPPPAAGCAPARSSRAPTTAPSRRRRSPPPAPRRRGTAPGSASKYGSHRRDHRLLQHELGHQRLVRAGVAPPRKIALRPVVPRRSRRDRCRSFRARIVVQGRWWPGRPHRTRHRHRRPRSRAATSQPIYCLSGERYLVDATASRDPHGRAGRGGRRRRVQQRHLRSEGERHRRRDRDRPHAADDGAAAGWSSARRSTRSRPPTSSRCAPTSRIPTRRPACVLVGDKVDVRLRAFAALRKRGYLHVFAPLRDNALAGWLRAEARSAQDRDRARRRDALATLAGPDLGPPGPGAGAARRSTSAAIARSPSTTSRTWSPRRASTASSS